MGASGNAVLVDVRTDAEHAWVGQVPGAKVVAWKQWPQMLMNPDFDTQLQAVVPSGSKVLLLCRSGVRSVAAAQRATELGLQAYSIWEVLRAIWMPTANAASSMAGAIERVAWQR